MQFFKRDKKDEQDEDPIYPDPSPLVERTKAALAQNEPTDEEMRREQGLAEERHAPLPPTDAPPPSPPRFLESSTPPRSSEPTSRQPDVAPRIPDPSLRLPEPAPRIPEPAPRIPEQAPRMQGPPRMPESYPRASEPQRAPEPMPQSPQSRFDPRPQQRPERPAPSSQGKWNPEGERRPMNPVPRERLPYPDLPMPSQERPQDWERERERSSPRAPQAVTPSARTVISRESTFNGNVRSDGDLLIEGTFEGEIDCKGTVIIAEGANVSATIRARNSTVAGSANGDFSCEERLTIQSTGEMRGKAQAPTLIVEEGAFFEGEFKMGSGGFTSTTSNLSSWQSGRSGRPESSRSLSPQLEESSATEDDSDDEADEQSNNDAWT